MLVLKVFQRLVQYEIIRCRNIDVLEQEYMMLGNQYRPGAAINQQTTLWASSDSGHLEVVRFLYEYEADFHDHKATNKQPQEMWLLRRIVVQRLTGSV